MTGKVSTAKGKSGAKKPAPKHKNAFAFTTNKHSFISLKIAALPVHGLCGHCLEIISWKKRINKYKPLTQPKKCVDCFQRTVKDAYHVLCNECAKKKKVCAKCQSKAQVIDGEKSLKEKIQEEQELQMKLEFLSERQRRSYHRKIEKGETEAAQRILEKIEDEDDDFDDDLDDSLEDLNLEEDEDSENEDSESFITEE